jgi:hypothetical protein
VRQLKIRPSNAALVNIIGHMAGVHSTKEISVMENQIIREPYPERAYAVVISDSAIRRPEWSGLSQVEAMRLAENLQHGGNIARVMHVVGDKSYEVDRYPPR